MENPVLAFNLILGLAAFFGGMVIRDLSQAVKDLRKADQELANKLDGYAKKDDIHEVKLMIREVREEERMMFNRVFDKLEAISDDLRNKVSRDECSTCGFSGK